MCLAAVSRTSSPFGSIVFSSFSALAASSSSLKGDIGNTGQAVDNKKIKGEALMGAKLNRFNSTTQVRAATAPFWIWMCTFRVALR